MTDKTAAERIMEWLYVTRHQNPVVIAKDVRDDIVLLMNDASYLKKSLENEKRRADKFKSKLNIAYMRANEKPIPMRIVCPECRMLHIDHPPFDTKPHHTHACQGCGNVWRPAIEHTIGVQFLPGFKNDDPTERVPKKALHSSHMFRDDDGSPSKYRCDLCDAGTFISLHAPCPVDKTS